MKLLRCSDQRMMPLLCGRMIGSTLKKVDIPSCLVKRGSCDKAWKFSLVLVAKGRHSPLALSCPLLCLASKVARHPGTYWVGRRTVSFAIQSKEGAAHSREVTKQKTQVLACETAYPFLQTNQENWRRE